jgi:hypothetical protein
MKKFTSDAFNSDEDLERILKGGQPDINSALDLLKSQREQEERAL